MIIKIINLGDNVLKKYIKFYSISIAIIIGLLVLLFYKMDSTYEAKYNSIIFKSLSRDFLSKKLNKQNLDIESLNLKNKENITLSIENNEFKIVVLNNDYRKCLKYGVDYIDSDFTSILINNSLLTRRDATTRDIILAKCDKNLNNIILSEKLERK